MRSQAAIDEYDNGCLVIRHYPENATLLKVRGKYYQPSPGVIDDITRLSEAIRHETINDSLAIFLVSFLIIIASLIWHVTTASRTQLGADVIVMVVVLTINVFLHEAAHVGLLKTLLPRARLKIGARLVPPFPSFYIDTTDSYQLPKYKRLSVYLAGLVANALYILVVPLLFPWLANYSYLVFSMMLLNIIPVLRGDGYSCLLVLMNKRSVVHRGRASWLEDLARGSILLCALLAGGLLLGGVF